MPDAGAEAALSRLVSQKDETCDSDSSLTETIVQVSE